MATFNDVGDYFAALYFDTQSKADEASGRLYNCNAKLNSVQYRVEGAEGEGYAILSGTIKLSGDSTQANFTLQTNPSFKRDALKRAP